MNEAKAANVKDRPRTRQSAGYAGKTSELSDVYVFARLEMIRLIGQCYLSTGVTSTSHLYEAKGSP